MPLIIAPDIIGEYSSQVATNYWAVRLAGAPDFLAIQAAAHELSCHMPERIPCGFKDARAAIIFATP
jgi:hypothetical protein